MFRFKLETILEKELLLPSEKHLFDGQDLSKYWWVPMNWACQLVQDNSSNGIIKDTKDVIGSLTRFQQSLSGLLEYHLNPIPVLCCHAVHIAAWGFLIFGACASQTCEGKHAWHLIFVLVSLCIVTI